MCHFIFGLDILIYILFWLNNQDGYRGLTVTRKGDEMNKLYPNKYKLLETQKKIHLFSPKKLPICQLSFNFLVLKWFTYKYYFYFLISIITKTLDHIQQLELEIEIETCLTSPSLSDLKRVQWFQLNFFKWPIFRIFHFWVI